MTGQIAPLIVAHGLAMSSSIVLFSVQSTLILIGNRRLHMVIGRHQLDLYVEQARRVEGFTLKHRRPPFRASALPSAPRFDLAVPRVRW